MRSRNSGPERQEAQLSKVTGNREAVDSWRKISIALMYCLIAYDAGSESFRERRKSCRLITRGHQGVALAFPRNSNIRQVLPFRERESWKFRNTFS